MPCMGPDCNFAEKQAIEAHVSIIEMLKKPPYNLCFNKDIVDKNPNSRVSKNFGVKEEQVEQLKSLLIEIFVDEACSTW